MAVLPTTLIRGSTLPILAFAFLTWIVYLAGLAALQNSCNRQGLVAYTGVYGFSAAEQSCSKIYRYWWFVMAWEAVVLIGAFFAAGHAFGLARSRAFWIGMFAVSTILFMQASEAFLSATDVSGGGSLYHRAATTAAGAIMTVVANVLCMLALGLEYERTFDNGIGAKHTAVGTGMGPGVGTGVAGPGVATVPGGAVDRV